MGIDKIKMNERQNEIKSIDLLVAEDTPENMEAAAFNKENDLHYHPYGSRFGKAKRKGRAMTLGRIVEQYAEQNK